MTIVEKIAQSFTSCGQRVSARQIADAIDLLANAPTAFEASDLAPAILPHATYHGTQEALNRLMQRWRKLGLVSFKTGRWRLEAGAWDTMQTAATLAREPHP